MFYNHLNTDDDAESNDISSKDCHSQLQQNELLPNTTRVLFCGDGVNDAPALACADVSVSMGSNTTTSNGSSASSLAIEISDVTLMDSNLHNLLYVIEMGSSVTSTIHENILLSFVCKFVVILLTFFGYMTLLYAIASDVGVMLIVTLNGLKLLPTSSSTKKPT